MYLIQFFCRPKLDLRQYNMAIQSNGSTCCPLNLYPLSGYPSGHCLMASEFYPGQLIFMYMQVVKKVKLHHWISQYTYYDQKQFFSPLPLLKAEIFSVGGVWIFSRMIQCCANKPASLNNANN